MDGLRGTRRSTVADTLGTAGSADRDIAAKRDDRLVTTDRVAVDQEAADDPVSVPRGDTPPRADGWVLAAGPPRPPERAGDRAEATGQRRPETATPPLDLRLSALGRTLRKGGMDGPLTLRREPRRPG